MPKFKITNWIDLDGSLTADGYMLVVADEATLRAATAAIDCTTTLSGLFEEDRLPDTGADMAMPSVRIVEA